MQEDQALKADEAKLLALELKSKIRTGLIKNANEKEIKKIIEGLGEKEWLLRKTFSKSLETIGKPCLPALSDALLHHNNVIVRRAAAKTLKLVGDSSTLPYLLKALLNDPDPVVQGSSAGAMAVFGNKAVELLLQILIDPNSTSIQSGLAIWTLSFIGSEAHESLLAAAKSQNHVIRAAAIAALGDQIHSLNDKAARTLLVDSLNDKYAEVRSQATLLIGLLNEPKWAEPLLTKMLGDPDMEVRKNSALSLMKIRAKNSIKYLKERTLIEQEESVIRILKLAIKLIQKTITKDLES